MDTLTKLNAKLTAMGFRQADHYVKIFEQFNMENISKPQSIIDDASRVYTCDLLDRYSFYYTSFIRDGIKLQYDAVLNVGDIIIVNYIEHGSSITETCRITENGHEVLECISDMKGYIADEGYRNGIYLYPGIRKDFFNLVELPECGITHELFDYIFSQLKP